MKILITGGNGFVARNLTEKLRKKHDIFAPNKQELNLLNSSSVYNNLKDNKFDIVIHTATYDAAPKHSLKDPTRVLENNLRMFFNIARCENYFDKMIYFGSGAEFAREHWKPRMKEDYFDKNIPNDQYGLSKYIMTKYALSKSKIYNLRLFAVFGKYEDWKVRPISSFCHNTSQNIPIEINQNKFYDFLFIDDLSSIVEWFIKNEPQHKVYNVCSGKTIDFKTIAEKVLTISGKNLEIRIKEKGLGKEYSGDNSLLLSEMKNFKFTSLDHAIKNVYDWYVNKAEEDKD